jgi:hypothetical protein
MIHALPVAGLLALASQLATADPRVAFTSNGKHILAGCGDHKVHRLGD